MIELLLFSQELIHFHFHLIELFCLNQQLRFSQTYLTTWCSSRGYLLSLLLFSYIDSDSKHIELLCCFSEQLCDLKEFSFDVSWLILQLDPMLSSEILSDLLVELGSIVVAISLAKASCHACHIILHIGLQLTVHSSDPQRRLPILIAADHHCYSIVQLCDTYLL